MYNDSHENIWKYRKSSHIQFAIRNWKFRLCKFVTHLEAVARALGVVRKHRQLLDRFQHRNKLLHQSHSGWRAPIILIPEARLKEINSFHRVFTADLCLRFIIVLWNKKSWTLRVQAVIKPKKCSQYTKLERWKSAHIESAEERLDEPTALKLVGRGCMLILQ